LRLRHSRSLAVLPPVRQFVAGHRRIARAGSVQNFSRSGNVGIARVTPKELQGAHDGKLLSHSYIDQLIESNPL